MNDLSQVLAPTRGDPWFNDGNVVLLAESESPSTGVAFKVHRGVVARHSEIFETMFDLPPPVIGDADELIEGCRVVPMIGDRPNELGDFIKALYDGAIFQHRNVEDFFYLAGILRLATKYFVQRLRQQAIRHLEETWSSTIQGHDAMVSRALSSPTVGGTSYPYVHPLHVINLARETNVSIVMPSAIYFLSIYPLADVLRADHPKLLVKHPSAPPSSLTSDQLINYTLMYQHRQQIMLEFMHKSCGERKPDSRCTGDAVICKRSFTKLAYQIALSLSVRTGVFHNMLQATHWVESDETLCKTCKRSFREDVAAQRDKWWKALPSVIGLPGWDTLVERDLSPMSP